MNKYGVAVDDLPEDALETEPTTRPRPREQQRVQTDPGFEELQNDNSAEKNGDGRQDQGTQPIGLGDGSFPSPGSDWINIDGIIQSFLRENDLNSGEQVAYGGATAYTQADRQQNIHTSAQPVLSGPANFPVGFPAGLNQFSAGLAPSNTAEIESGNQWQHAFWPSNHDTAFLEDPLFGFNGSFTGEFQFTGR